MARLGSSARAAVLLGATHLLITATLFAAGRLARILPVRRQPADSLALVILLDAVAAGLLVTRIEFNFAPHTVVRSIGVYLALVGLLWTWFGWTVADDAFVTPIAAAPIAMAAGIAMGTIVSMNSPPLAMSTSWCRSRRRCARRFAADSRRGRDPVARLVGLQHRRAPAASFRRGASAFASKRRRARPSISSTSSKAPAAAGSGKPTISARSPMFRSSLPTTSNATRTSCSAASSPICCRSTRAPPT